MWAWKSTTGSTQPRPHVVPVELSDALDGGFRDENQFLEQILEFNQEHIQYINTYKYRPAWKDKSLNYQRLPQKVSPKIPGKLAAGDFLNHRLKKS
jgi:hypothetical protein